MTAQRWLPPWIICAAVFIAFLPALDGQFLNWDDDLNFLGNRGFRGLGAAQLRWMWTTPLLGHYIPLTWMSLGLNYVLGGMDPWGYHLGNVLIHAANAVLVYAIARRLLIAAGISTGLAPAGASFAALCFGVHPLRVESVAWITERRDVLCSLFFLLAVLLYLKSLDPRGGRLHRLLSLAAFAASLLSKAQGLPLPLALLILDGYPLRRVATTGWRRLILEKAPYFAISLVGSAVALIAVKSGASFTDYAQYGPLARVAMTAYGIVFFPWKFLWPAGLSPLYELPARIDPMAWRFVVPAVVLVAVTGLLIKLKRWWPAGLAVWVYSAVMVLPVIGPVHAGNQLAHDRYSYLSGLGFAVLAGACVAVILRAVARQALSPVIGQATVAGAILAVLGLGSGTWVQTQAWRDSESLWRWAVETDPLCAICHNNLAQVFAARGQTVDAERSFRRALALRTLPMARNNLAGVLQLQGRFDEAEREYRGALSEEPRLTPASMNLGELYVAQRRYEEALPLLRLVFQESPNVPRLRPALSQALRRRGDELARVGRSSEAQRLFTEALQVQR